MKLLFYLDGRFVKRPGEASDDELVFALLFRHMVVKPAGSQEATMQFAVSYTHLTLPTILLV